ncbi:hypothetical protein ACNKHM_07795 [Shigella sonnei]
MDFKTKPTSSVRWPNHRKRSPAQRREAGALVRRFRSALAEAEVESTTKLPLHRRRFQAVNRSALKAKFGVTALTAQSRCDLDHDSVDTARQPRHRHCTRFDYALVQVEGQAVILANELVRG